MLHDRFDITQAVYLKSNYFLCSIKICYSICPRADLTQQQTVLLDDACRRRISVNIAVKWLHVAKPNKFYNRPQTYPNFDTFE